ncbi:glycosyltransferase [Gemmobacter denitrificans]|uniref:Glycosyltransferase n=1 Tax=Gemmobacter denitrificans TaxID=3123040 RepID=A0ABU8BUN5_9RHOB
MSSGSLLIYAPVPLYRDGNGGFLLEDQACNGMRLWAENFDRVIAIMPVEEGPAPGRWVPLDTIGPALARIDFVPLPAAWGLRSFLRALPAARRAIRAAIAKADRMGFAIGGLVGDWGAVAAFEARAMRRPFYVWTDRVESAVTRFAARSAPRFKTRLKAAVTWAPMAMLERAVVRRADLGLFHGQETFNHYAPYCRNPQIVHDIHLKRADHLPVAEVATKQSGTAEGPLRLMYLGRADAMKGGLDWVEVVAQAIAAGADVDAEWFGAGEDLERMRARVAELGLQDRICLPGQVTDRAAVRAALARAQVFLFCHQTPESPRCLIEALAACTPLLGYGDAFAEELVSRAGGGILVPRGDVAALAAQVVALAADRARVADLIGRAARDREGFDDEAVFRHRSEVIKTHLPGPGSFVQQA